LGRSCDFQVDAWIGWTKGPNCLFNLAGAKIEHDQLRLRLELLKSRIFHIRALFLDPGLDRDAEDFHLVEKYNAQFRATSKNRRNRLSESRATDGGRQIRQIWVH
jgi:hypothetical protein